MGDYNAPPDLITEFHRMRERIAALERQTQQASEPGGVGQVLGVKSIPNATPTVVAWDDGAGPMWNASNPTRLTAKAPGNYLFQILAAFDSNATGRRTAVLMRNGVAMHTEAKAAISGEYTTLALSVVLGVEALGDYYEARLFQNSGAALNIENGGSGYLSLFAAFRLGM